MRSAFPWVTPAHAPQKLAPNLKIYLDPAPTPQATEVGRS